MSGDNIEALLHQQRLKLRNIAFALSKTVLPEQAEQRLGEMQRGQLEIVFVVANQNAQLRLAKTGRRFGDTVEILSGLDANDSVVVNGADQLSDGQPLETK